MQQQTWTIESGLPQNSVHDVLQSRDGFLWVATEDGVARFDGFSFVVESSRTVPAFTSNDICCIAETSGAMWFGTDDGLIEQKGSSFRRWGESEGLPSSEILSTVPAKDGSLLVLTTLGAVQVRDGRAGPVPFGPANAEAIGAGRGGTVLMVAHRTLYRYTGTAAVPVRSDLPSQVLGVAEAADGTVWLRTATQFVVLLPGGQRRWAVGQQIAGSRTQSLQPDAAPNTEGVWAGTNRGLFHLYTGNPIATQQVELGTASVLSTATDREGDIWVGTETSGLHEFRRIAVTTLTGLADEVVTSVVQAHDGTVWLGTRDDGVRTVRAGKVSQPAASPKLTSQAVFSVAADLDGSVWAGTPDGLDHLRDAAVEQVTSANGLPDDFARSVLVDRDASVWVGTRRGLVHLQNGAVRATLTSADGLPSEMIGAMLQTRSGDLWVGTAAGVARVHGDRVIAPVAAGQTPAPAGEAVTALDEDNAGYLWIGTRSGHLRRIAQGRALTLAMPVVRGGISAILDDGAGYLWLRSSTGIERVPLAALNACADLKSTSPNEVCHVPMRSYGIADGMPSLELPSEGHPSAWRMQDGSLWFATRKGVAIVHPRELVTDYVPPPIALEQVLVDDRPQPLGAQLRLPYGHSRLQFSFAGLSFAAPARVRYRYRLRGFDAGWVDAGARREAFYTGLPPGHFEFQVEAINPDGVASLSPASMDVVITPPIYRRWGFYAGCALLLAAIVYAIYRMRLRRVQREFDAVLAERNRIAREIHDTLAQDFVAVALQLEVAAQLLKAEKLAAAKEQIDNTRAMVRDGIKDARESIWALRNSSESLPARLTEMVKRAQADVGERDRTRITFSVSGAYRALSTEVEGELLRIAKEALGNSLRHAHANEVDVLLLYNRNAVELTIRDNGCGFDMEQAAKLDGHYGLRGMQERATRIRASFSVSSKPGGGTTLAAKLSERNSG